MSSQPHNIQEAITLEERAYRLRMAILRDEAFMEGVRQGHEAAERGDVVPLAELDRELGWNT